MAFRKTPDELVVITRAYDFILWSCNHVSKFPRNHRFVPGERIERTLYDLLETLIEAKFTRTRTALLQRANLTLEILRFQIRLAKDLQCLKVVSYGFAAKAIDDIGKLIGGWLKTGYSRITVTTMKSRVEALLHFPRISQNATVSSEASRLRRSPQTDGL